jgi:hypothetical protein
MRMRIKRVKRRTEQEKRKVERVRMMGIEQVKRRT